jgi:endonuclease/exonuclease/phosphatase family metal-dependent hydrolase
MITAANPDIVGLVEATNPHVVEELARRLGMQHVMSAYPTHIQDWEVALLSRLPIISSKTHLNPQVMTKPVLEVCLEEPDGTQFSVFVTHLAAAFSHGWAGDAIRRREVRELIRIMGEHSGTPHLVMGDFNSLSPGDPFRASALLRYIVKLDKIHQKTPSATIGHPYLDFVVPAPLRIFTPLLRIIPRSKLLCWLFDAAASLYAPRGCISLLKNAGYIDCFRELNPTAKGFSCPSGAPAGRIDYIFASPELAQDLSLCYIPTEGNGTSGEAASDHLPVVAEFALPVKKISSVEHVMETGEEVQV